MQWDKGKKACIIQIIKVQIQSYESKSNQVGSFVGLRKQR